VGTFFNSIESTYKYYASLDSKEAKNQREIVAKKPDDNYINSIYKKHRI